MVLMHRVKCKNPGQVHVRLGNDSIFSPKSNCKSRQKAEAGQKTGCGTKGRAVDSLEDDHNFISVREVKKKIKCIPHISSFLGFFYIFFVIARFLCDYLIVIIQPLLFVDLILH